MWLVEWRKVTVMHLRHALKNNFVPSSAKRQPEMSIFEVMWQLEKAALTTLVKFVIITERYAAVIVRHLGNFGARGTSFQIQNGCCMRRLYCASTIFDNDASALICYVLGLWKADDNYVGPWSRHCFCLERFDHSKRCTVSFGCSCTGEQKQGSQKTK